MKASIVAAVFSTLAVTSTSAWATSIDHVSGAVTLESFEGIRSGTDANVSYNSSAHITFVNGDVTLHSGAVLTGPSGRGQEYFFDYNLGNPQLGLSGNQGGVSQASDVPDGVAFLVVDSQLATFTLPFDVCQVGLVVDAGSAYATQIQMTVYDASGTQIDTAGIAPTTTANWPANFIGLGDANGAIRKVTINGNNGSGLGFTIMDQLQFATASTTPVVTTADESAGANCPYGGVSITVSSGCLPSTSYLCSLAPEAASLVNLTDEPAGDNCASGGVRIDQGIDTDRNGTLDATEVTTTKYVCNAVAGTNGSDGTNGANGADGVPGETGQTGATGATGKDGGCAATEPASFAILGTLALLLRRRR